ncbi:uncharacterized protein I303_107180 [Kwoniella dejecticola CBS 10117]|uniref:Uncharacterized protein n=1 Tax=Kwoniella dejecticola CBS 10117 TaxID=1296121 RepID=A0AAJ8KTN7_9TREE
MTFDDSRADFLVATCRSCNVSSVFNKNRLDQAALERISRDLGITYSQERPIESVYNDIRDHVSSLRSKIEQLEKSEQITVSKNEESSARVRDLLHQKIADERGSDVAGQSTSATAADQQDVEVVRVGNKRGINAPTCDPCDPCDPFCLCLQALGEAAETNCNSYALATTACGVVTLGTVGAALIASAMASSAGSA